MKRYLGIVCLLYSLLMICMIYFDKLKNFLAPSMQIYVKIIIIPLMFVGLVMIFNNKINYKFKISDLILLIPFILLFLGGNFRLDSMIASNRSSNLNIDNINVVEEIKEEKEEIKEEVKQEIGKIDYDVDDMSYYDLSNYITFSTNENIVGRTIKVRGFALKNASFIMNGYFAIGKYVISCCAADASFTGFYVKNASLVDENSWYDIEGILDMYMDNNGNSYVYINVVNIEKIDQTNEEQYVYPCFSYGDGTCSFLNKYVMD